MKPTIIYDGQCKFCHRQIAIIKKKDTKNQFSYLSSQETKKLMKLGVAYEEALKGIILIDDKTYTKVSAIQRIYEKIAPGHFYAWSMKTVLTRTLASLVYAFIARYRYALFGRCTPQCRI